jgi:thiamine pyridinylase
MQHSLYQKGLYLVLAIPLLGCAVQDGPALSIDESGLEGSSVQQLRVSLYPWIPEAESFFRWIEADFESRNPDIDLIVRPVTQSYEWESDFVSDLAYETDKAITALTSPTSADAQDLIEIDTLTLGVLARARAIAPFDVAGMDFLPSATEAVTWNKKRVGVPHWTCGYFVISENPEIRAARNVEELVAVLRNAGTARVDIAGDMDGSWDSIAVYLDGFRDTYPNGDMLAALSRTELDPVVAEHFQHLGPACMQDGRNHCDDDAVDLFATGGSDSLFGFSERLNPILAHPRKTVGQLHIASATLGGGDAPTAFVDALVLSPRCSAPRCLSAASRFAAYYISDEVFESSLMGLDTENGIPRYLLPSTRTAFDFGQVAQDRLYLQLREEFQGAKAFPNAGVPEARETGSIRLQLQEALSL